MTSERRRTKLPPGVRAWAVRTRPDSLAPTADVPSSLDVAVPRGHRSPVTTGAITWHHFDRDTFAVGRDEITIAGTDLSIGIYSPERSIVDAFRMRGSIGYETGVDALKEWLRRGGKPAHLLTMATRLPRARQPLLQALQVIGLPEESRRDRGQRWRRSPRSMASTSLRSTSTLQPFLKRVSLPSAILRSSERRELRQYSTASGIVA